MTVSTRKLKPAADSFWEIFNCVRGFFRSGRRAAKDSFFVRSYALPSERCFRLVRFLPKTLPKRFT
jgi:hypothetical protein